LYGVVLRSGASFAERKLLRKERKETQCRGYDLGSLIKNSENTQNCLKIPALSKTHNHHDEQGEGCPRSVYEAALTMKIRRKVTIEVDRIKITVPHRAAESPSWCGICQAKAEFVEPDEAARLVNALAAKGVTVVEGDLHFYHPAYSRPLICLNSIIKEYK
jgi:hypothetical protein